MLSPSLNKDFTYLLTNLLTYLLTYLLKPSDIMTSKQCGLTFMFHSLMIGGIFMQYKLCHFCFDKHLYQDHANGQQNI